MLEPPDLRDQLDRQVLKVTVVVLERQVKTDLLDRLDLLVSRDNLELPDKLELLEILGSPEPRAHVVHPDQLAPREKWDQLGLQGQTETMETLGLRALPEPLGLLDNPDR